MEIGINKQELINHIEEVKGDKPHYREQYHLGRWQAIEGVLGLIDQLNESEITEEQAWDKIAETLPISVGTLKGIIYSAAFNGIPDYTQLKSPSMLEESDFDFEKTQETEQVDISKTETTTQLVEVPQFVGDWIEGIKSGEIPTVATGGDDLIFEICQQFYEETLPKELRNWFEHNVNSHVFYNAVLYGYTIEPPKTLQVIVKNYDSTVYKTDIPEDEAMKLIEGWKG